MGYLMLLSAILKIIAKFRINKSSKKIKVKKKFRLTMINR